MALDERLKWTLQDHDLRGERAIALGQAAICSFVLVLHLVAQFRSDWNSPNFWVISALAALTLSSGLRYALTLRGKLRNRAADILTVTDITIFLALIWSYQFAYDHPAGGVLKSPSFVLLAVLVGLRALRFHPRPIIIAGATAASGWCLLVFLSLHVDGHAAITHDYPQYLTSYKILIGAELERVVALLGLTTFLALATAHARSALSRAATAAYDATEYAYALNDSKQRFKDIVEISSDWIWEFDENLRFSYISDRFSQITGQPRERFLGKTRAEIADNSGPEWEAHLADLQARRPFRNFMCITHDETGRTLHWSVSGRPVFGADGTFKGYRGTGTDKTAEVEARQALIERERTYEQIATAVEQANDMIVLFDPDDRIVFANAAWRELNTVVEWTTKPGITFEQHIRALADGHFVPEAIGREEEWIAERLEAHRHPKGPFELPRQDGRCILINEQVLGDGSTIMIIKDISERKHLETELEEKNEALHERLIELEEKNILLDSQRDELATHRDALQKLVDEATAELKEHAGQLAHALSREKELNEQQRQFVAMASHEFRTPLAIIDSTAQRLRSRAEKSQLTPEDTLKRVETLRSAVQRMTRLMESTLKAARLEDGKISVEIGPCNIGALLQDACTRQQELAANHVISLALRDLPETIQADDGALEQVFVNLLSNAVKYSPERPPDRRFGGQPGGSCCDFGARLRSGRRRGRSAETVRAVFPGPDILGHSGHRHRPSPVEVAHRNA